MINSVSLTLESVKFRDELRNEFFINDIDPYEHGLWEYKGNWCHTKFELYITILAYEAAEQFGIIDITGLIAVLLGQAFITTRRKLKVL